MPIQPSFNPATAKPPKPLFSSEKTRTLGESAGSALRLNNNDVTVEARLPHSPSLAAPFFLPLEKVRGAPPCPGLPYDMSWAFYLTDTKAPRSHLTTYLLNSQYNKDHDDDGAAKKMAFFSFFTRPDWRQSHEEPGVMMWGILRQLLFQLLQWRKKTITFLNGLYTPLYLPGLLTSLILKEILYVEYTVCILLSTFIFTKFKNSVAIA